MSTYKHKFNIKYGFDKDEPHNKKEISKITNIPLKILNEVYDRGIGAWENNPRSVRIKGTMEKNPNLKKYPRSKRLSPYAWAMARVYSFVMGGKTYKTADKDLADKLKGGSKNNFIKGLNPNHKPLNTLYGRMGGKIKIKKDIVDLFPNDYQNMIYIEPFFGAGHVYFYKVPSKKEIINDIDERVYNIMNMFKKYDEKNIEKIINGTYTKKQFEDIKKFKPKNDFQKGIKDFLLIRLSFLSRGDNYNESKKKINKNVNGYKERLKNTIILNDDYKKVIKKYDNKDALFYLDPPYEGSKKSHYKNHSIDYNELKNILDNLKGKFIMSINDSKNIRELFKDYNMMNIKTRYSNKEQGTKEGHINELIITNYDKNNKLKGGSRNNFIKQLEEEDIEPNDYLGWAKERAEEKGLNPDELKFSDNKNKKLMYKKEHFGSVGNKDFLIYNFREWMGKDKEGTADKKRKNYKARAKKVYDKSEKLSSSWLSYNITW